MIYAILSLMPPNPTKHWIIEPVLPPEADQALVRFSPILRQLLYNRGYKTDQAARQYLEAQPPAGSDPLNMLGVPEAVERIGRLSRKRNRSPFMVTMTPMESPLPPCWQIC